MAENTTNNLSILSSSMMEKSSNVSICSYQWNREAFLEFSVIYLCIGLIAVIGNGLVLYATICTRNHGCLSYFDTAIKSLAFADMLFGLVGIPSRIAAMYYIGIKITIFNVKRYKLVLNIIAYSCSTSNLIILRHGGYFKRRNTSRLATKSNRFPSRCPGNFNYSTCCLAGLLALQYCT